MLLHFSVENWRIFKHEGRLEMTASRERYRNETCTTIDSISKELRVLPLAAIYGPNAAGKSSFLEALAFVRNMVVLGTQVNQMIPVTPYRLDSETKYEPSRFVIKMLVEGLVYNYELILSESAVESEYLGVLKKGREVPIFLRKRDDYDFGKDYKTPRNELISQNTRNNQLFLHNAVSQNALELLPVYNWFARSLSFVGVDPEYEQYSLILLRPDFKEYIDDKLRRYQTGVDEIVLDEVPVEIVPCPLEFVRNSLASSSDALTTYMQLRANIPGTNIPEIYVFQKDPLEELRAFKVRLLHYTDEGKPIRFDLIEESRGTQRLIELLPLFFDMAQDVGNEHEIEKVYLVDELDRSFHTALTEDLISEYIKTCSSKTKHQLIFTTHDLLLMESKSLRKDELWLCERGEDSTAQLKRIGSMNEVRTDTDLLNKYRKGRLGNYPEYH